MDVPPPGVYKQNTVGENGDFQPVSYTQNYLTNSNTSDGSKGWPGATNPL